VGGRFCLKTYKRVWRCLAKNTKLILPAPYTPHPDSSPTPAKPTIGAHATLLSHYSVAAGGAHGLECGHAQRLR